MSISRAQKVVSNKEQKGHAQSLGRFVDTNPLKYHKMTKWFKQSVSKANNKYTATFDEKKRLLELEELFSKFDLDGSGGLDLDELVQMFQMAGLRVQSQRLKNMFYLAKGVKIVNNEVDLEQFQKLMLSPELEEAFRVLLKEIRRRFKYNDFSMVDPEIGFLPSDLSLMLGYLYKRSVRQNLSDAVCSHKVTTTDGVSLSELYENTVEDFNRFKSMFHLHDDDSYDKELRQKYRISSLEKKFRQDQDPTKRKDLMRLRAITTFFLNRIKERAQTHQSLKKVVDKALLEHKMPKINNNLQMKMESEFDRVELSVENLHRVQEEKQQHEEAKLKAEDEFSGIMRALTLTKSNSALLDEPSLANTNTSKPVDLTKIKDKEERSLFELLSSLNENLEVLDGVKEVFDRAGTEESEEEVTILEQDEEMEQAEQILEGIPVPKRVTKGKAVFIVPDMSGPETSEQRRAKRNATIAKMMAEQTDSNGFEANQESASTPEKRQRCKNQKHLSSKLDAPAFRNAATMLHRSHLSQGQASEAFSSVLLEDNQVQALGKSVMNKRQVFKSPFKEQLQMDSKELMMDLLEKNREHNLSEFQKQTLRNLKNTSLRSKLIVYGDCVSQFERMVDHRSNLYQSMQGFKKVKVPQITDSQSSSKRVTGRYGHDRSFQQKSGQSELDSHLQIQMNESQELTIAQKKNLLTPMKQTDSLFSLSMNESAIASKNQASGKVNKDLSRELPGFGINNSQSVLLPLKANSGIQTREQMQQNNLLLMSQKIKMFASPSSKRVRHFKKQAASSLGHTNLTSTQNLKSKGSSELVTDATEVNHNLQSTAEVQYASHQVLPEITQTSSVQRNNKNVIFSTDKSQGSQSQINSILNPLKQASMRLENEPEINHKSSEPRFKRNQGAGQVRSMSQAQNINLPVKQLEQKSTKNWASNQHSMTNLDYHYNYGGYIAKKPPGAKKPIENKAQESFFNSKQALLDKRKEQSTNSHSVMLQRLAAPPKKRKQVADKAMEDVRPASISGFSHKSTVLKDNSQQEASQEVTIEDYKIQSSRSRAQNMKSQVSDQSAKDISSNNNMTNSNDDTILLEKKTTTTKKKKRKQGKKLSPSPKKELSSTSSVTKIMIVPPQVKLDYNSGQAYNEGYRQAEIHQFPSLGASSLNRNSEISSAQTGSGLPSLAAAQARSMTRKPNVISSNTRPMKQVRHTKPGSNDSSIEGIFGDSLLKVAESPNTASKETLFKLKHKKRRESQKIIVEQPPPLINQNAYVSTEQSASTRLEPAYAGLPTVVDEGHGIQKSLRGTSFADTTSVRQERQGEGHESVISSSSGQAAPHYTLGMTLNQNRPMYSGEIDSRMEAPHSSMNIHAQAALMNQQDYPLNNQKTIANENVYGQVLHQEMTHQFKPRSKGDKFEQTYFTTTSQDSYKTSIYKQEYEQKGIRHDQVKNLLSKLEKDKAVNKAIKGPSPFQKFQERMKKLEETTQNVTVFKQLEQTSEESSLATPLFRGAIQKQSVGGIKSGTAQTGTHSGSNVIASQSMQSRWINHVQSKGSNSGAVSGNMNHQLVASSKHFSKDHETASMWNSAEGQLFRQVVQKQKEKSQMSQNSQQSSNEFLKRKMSQTQNQALAGKRRMSKEQVASSVEESQILSVTKISLPKHPSIPAPKVVNVGNARNEDQSAASVGLTENIDHSASMSIQKSDLKNKELNKDLPMMSQTKDERGQMSKTKEAFQSYNPGHISIEGVSPRTDTLTNPGSIQTGSIHTRQLDRANDDKLLLLKDHLSSQPINSGMNSLENTPLGKVATDQSMTEAHEKLNAFVNQRQSAQNSRDHKKGSPLD